MTETNTTAPAAPPAAPWAASDDTFGARLALVRQRMGWGNVKKAAEECGLPVQSWRTWERDGVLPHRLTTIAMAIATRTGCDPNWLVWGPSRGAVASPTLQDLLELYAEPARPGRVVVTIGQTNRQPKPSIRLEPTTRAVAQTQPNVRKSHPGLPVPA